MNIVQQQERVKALGIDGQQRPFDKVKHKNADPRYKYQVAQVTGCERCNNTGLVVDFVDCVGPSTKLSDRDQASLDAHRAKGKKGVIPKYQDEPIIVDDGTWAHYAGTVLIDYCNCGLGYAVACCSGVSFIDDHTWKGYGDHPEDFELIPSPVPSECWPETFTIRDGQVVE